MRVHSNISRSKQLWLLSAVVCCGLIALVAFTRGIVFETIDDYNVMMTISGEKTGAPYFQLTFFNSVYSFIMSLFYRAFPYIQWYTWTQLALVACSVTSILRLLIERCLECGLKPIVPVVFFCIFSVDFFLYPVQRLQFTSTAALLGMTSIYYLFSIDPNSCDGETAKQRFVFSSIFLGLCLIERRSVGFCASAFYFFGFIRLWIVVGERSSPLKHYRRLLNGGIRIGVVAVAIAACFLVGHVALTRFGDNAGYSSYDKVRAAYQDHPHPSYEDATDLYESVGWDYTIFMLASSLIYIDESVNEETFATIVESPENEQVQPSITQAVKLDLSILSNKAARAIAIGLFGLFVALSCLGYANIRTGDVKIRTIDYLYSVFMCFVAVGLSLYVCLSGRWSLRTFQAITFPLAACLLAGIGNQLCISTNYVKSVSCERLNPMGHSLTQIGQDYRYAALESGKHMARVHDSALCRSCIAVSMVVLCWALGWSYAYAENYDEVLLERDSFSIPQMRSIEEYAIEHPDDVFLHDYSVSNYYNSYDPFRRYAENPPSNLIISGGSYTYTGCYYEQLRVNGLDSFTGETLLLDNVYYISDSDRGAPYRQLVLAYLQSLYGDITMETVDTLENGATVYKYCHGSNAGQDELLEGDASNSLPSTDAVESLLGNGIDWSG